MLVLLSILIFNSVFDEVDSAYDASLIRNAEAIITILSHGEFDPLTDRMNLAPSAFDHKELFEHVKKKNGVAIGDRFYRIWRGGRLISSSYPDFNGLLPAGLSTININREQWRAYSLRPTDSDLVVEVAHKRSLSEQFLRNLLEDFLLSLALIIPSVGFFIWSGIQSGLLPVRTLVLEIQKRGADNLSRMSSKSMPDDLKPLVSSINSLLSQLDWSLLAERTFSDHVAHQLRTAQARSILLIQLLQRSTNKYEHDDLLDRLLQSNQRNSEMIEKLLVLGRVTHLELSYIEFSLAELVSSILEEARVKAERKSILFVFSINDQIYLKSDPTLLRIMVENIVDNALKYSPVGGTVTVIIKVADHKKWNIVISDEGKGIPAIQLNAVFDRFYRAETSSRDGLGLGLSIVKLVGERLGIYTQLTKRAHGSGLKVVLQGSL